MSIMPLPVFEADADPARRDAMTEQELYDQLEPPKTIVVRFGSMKMIGEFPQVGGQRCELGLDSVVGRDGHARECATTRPPRPTTREDGPVMGTGRWWEQRRFGLMVQTSLASVPGWAPLGQDAAWYRAHTDGTASDVLLHPSPLVETLAHHRDRWAHEDALGYELYAEAIAEFVRNESTRPPLVVGIQAPWGQGKTTLMRMVQGQLDPEHPDLVEESTAAPQGENDATVGVRTTVKSSGLVVEPFAFVTRILPTCAGAGTSARISELEITVNEAGSPSNFTLVVPSKPAPMIVISSPGRPKFGSAESTFGFALGLKSRWLCR